MDYFIYNLTGYKTNSLLENSARLIQKAYKNHRSYELYRRLDMIRYRENNMIRKNEKVEEKEELEYWNYQREKIKCYSRSLKSLGWVYT